MEAMLILARAQNVKFTFNGKSEEYSIRPPAMCNNSILPGQYADPDIDYFDGKFWIFPTTDGYPGWSGTLFHAWSSEDMVSWTDEGVIMELANDNPGLNEKGIQIASSDWQYVEAHGLLLLRKRMADIISITAVKILTVLHKSELQQQINRKDRILTLADRLLRLKNVMSLAYVWVRQ